MDPDVYLRKHHLLTYVEDVILLLLSRKDEDPKTKPFELLTDYFKSIRNGSHIVFREYDFISATPHNRKSFIATFWKTYGSVPECSVPMKIIEFHSLLKLLCSDFPLTETQKVPRALFGSDSTSNIISFADFIYTFQVTFYFDYFLRQLETAYPSLLSGSYHPSLYSQPSFTAVVVPIPPVSTSQLSDPATQVSSEIFSRAVSSGILLDAALGLCQMIAENEPGQSCPSQEALREALNGGGELSFHEFVLKLSLSNLVIREIGPLPPKT